MQRVCSMLTAFVVGLTLTVAAQQAAVDPNRWEETIRKFEAEDAAHAPAKGGVLFIGSSSIARWSNR